MLPGFDFPPLRREALSCLWPFLWDSRFVYDSPTVFFFPVPFSVGANQYIHLASYLPSSWFIPGGFLKVKDERLFLVPTGIRKKLSIMPRFKPWDENLRLWMTLDMKQQHVIRVDWHFLSTLPVCSAGGRAVIWGLFFGLLWSPKQ